MKKNYILFVVLILFLFVITPCLSAATIYVDCNSTSPRETGTLRYPYHTIQAAVDRSERIRGRDIIIVIGGEYIEDVLISRNDELIIKGMGQGKVVLRSRSSYEGTISVRNYGRGYRMKINLEVRNITFCGYAANGLFLETVEGVVIIENCRFIDDDRRGIESSLLCQSLETESSFLEPTSKLIFRRNIIDIPWTYYGMYIRNSGNAAGNINISNNLFLSCHSGMAISLLGSQGVSIYNNTFNDCYGALLVLNEYGIAGPTRGRVFPIIKVFFYNNIFNQLSRYGVAVGETYRALRGAGMVHDPEINAYYNDFYFGSMEPISEIANGFSASSYIGENLRVDPLLDYSNSLRLLSGSPCIDAGDPGILDADRTRSDMGAYGGPEPLR